jgi:putative nucleotidyltransferase with HDIG domain
LASVADKILAHINNLPTLPTVYSAISEAMQNPLVTTDEIARIISSDQSTAFKVIKVANSAYYGFTTKIDTISNAIFYLGFNEIKNLVLAVSIMNMFSKNKLLLKFKPVDFWAHSIAVGVASRLIGESVGNINLDNYFLAGVLHDIGKLIFFEYISDEYANVLTYSEESAIEIREAELKILGINHQTIGGLVADQWKLPSNIKNVIRYHHNPNIVTSADKLMVSVIHLADILVKSLCLGYSGDNFVPRPDKEIVANLKLPDDIFHKIYNILVAEFQQTSAMLLSN